MTLAEGFEGGRGWVQPADASLVLADEGLRLAGPRLSRKVVICQLAFTQHALRHRPEQRNVRSKERLDGSIIKKQPCKCVSDSACEKTARAIRGLQVC